MCETTQLVSELNPCVKHLNAETLELLEALGQRHPGALLDEIADVMYYAEQLLRIVKMHVPPETLEYYRAFKHQARSVRGKDKHFELVHASACMAAAGFNHPGSN